MSEKEIREEIEEIRGQLEALKKEREAEKRAKKSAPSKRARKKVAGPDDGGSEPGDAVREEGVLASHFREFIDALDEDIKDTKPTTLLIVFAVGLLVGRLT